MPDVDDWWNRAACAPHLRPAWATAELWTEPPRRHGWGAGPQAWAIRICRSCPVREQCLRDALRTESATSWRWGVWAGLTPQQREDLGAKAAA